MATETASATVTSTTTKDKEGGIDGGGVDGVPAR